MNVKDLKVLIDTLAGINETDADIWMNEGRDGRDEWVQMKIQAIKLNDHIVLEVMRK
jgi:hypothetical protein